MSARVRRLKCVGCERVFIPGHDDMWLGGTFWESDNEFLCRDCWRGLRDAAKAKMGEALLVLGQSEAIWRTAPAPVSLVVSLLLDYARKQPRDYLQLDGFGGVHPDDDVLQADGDGDSLTSSWQTELRHGPPEVRVQILADTIREDAARLLRKLLEWLETSFDPVLGPAPPRTPWKAFSVRTPETETGDDHGEGA